MTGSTTKRPAEGRPGAQGATAPKPPVAPGATARGAKARPADGGRSPSEGPQTPRPPLEGTKNFWLVKSEPDAFSWDQQVANGVEPWTGVRNHMAKANLMAMKKGDRAFFYHSNIGKEIVGVVEVIREAYPDPSAEAGAPWVCVDMKAVGPVPRPVTLAAIKAEPSLEGIALVRMSRLSVMPISPEHWTILATMGGWKGQ
jgi:predicted RNA-binding protein with PUA-like domain